MLNSIFKLKRDVRILLVGLDAEGKQQSSATQALTIHHYHLNHRFQRGTSRQERWLHRVTCWWTGYNCKSRCGPNTILVEMNQSCGGVTRLRSDTSSS
jgi:hypothetical protein